MPTFSQGVLIVWVRQQKEPKMKQLIIVGATLATFVVSPALSAPQQARPQAAICNGQVVGQDTDQNIVAALVRACGHEADAD
jgi:hypothetical protein